MQQDRRRFLMGGAGAIGFSNIIDPPLARAAPGRGAAGMMLAGGGVNIRDFGAKGDGVTIDTRAIDRAIDSVSRKGGGIVYVPAGVYACYTIHLKSHVTIYLEQGAAMAALKPLIKDDGYPEPNRFGDLPASGLFVRQVKNLVMRDVEIVTQAPDARPAFWMQDVNGVDGFALRVPRGPAFALDNVSNFRTFGSLTVPDKQFLKPVSANF